MHEQTQLVCNSLLNRQPMYLHQSWIGRVPGGHASTSLKINEKLMSSLSEFASSEETSVNYILISEWSWAVFFSLENYKYAVEY